MQDRAITPGCVCVMEHRFKPVSGDYFRVWPGAENRYPFALVLMAPDGSLKRSPVEFICKQKLSRKLVGIHVGVVLRMPGVFCEEGTGVPAERSGGGHVG